MPPSLFSPFLVLIFFFLLPSLIHPPPCLPFPRILTCLFHYLLIILLCLSILLLFLFPRLLPSLLHPPILSHITSWLVTFSSSTWSCRQENQALPELRQAEPNAGRARKPALLTADGERREAGRRGASGTSPGPFCPAVLLLLMQWGWTSEMWETVYTRQSFGCS